MTTEIVASASTLTPEQAELQARARAFVEVLIPLEVEAERARGRLPAERIAGIRHAAIDRRLGGGLHAVVTDVSSLGLERFDAAGRSSLPADPIALPFPAAIGP